MMIEAGDITSGPLRSEKERNEFLNNVVTVSRGRSYDRIHRMFDIRANWAQCQIVPAGDMEHLSSLSVNGMLLIKRIQGSWHTNEYKIVPPLSKLYHIFLDQVASAIFSQVRIPSRVPLGKHKVDKYCGLLLKGNYRFQLVKGHLWALLKPDPPQEIKEEPEENALEGHTGIAVTPKEEIVTLQEANAEQLVLADDQLGIDNSQDVRASDSLTLPRIAVTQEEQIVTLQEVNTEQLVQADDQIGIDNSQHVQVSDNLTLSRKRARPLYDDVLKAHETMAAAFHFKEADLSVRLERKEAENKDLMERLELVEAEKTTLTESYRRLSEESYRYLTERLRTVQADNRALTESNRRLTESNRRLTERLELVERNSALPESNGSLTERLENLEAENSCLIV